MAADRLVFNVFESENESTAVAFVTYFDDGSRKCAGASARIGLEISTSTAWVLSSKIT